MVTIQQFKEVIQLINRMQDYTVEDIKFFITDSDGIETYTLSVSELINFIDDKVSKYSHITIPKIGEFVLQSNRGIKMYTILFAKGFKDFTKYVWEVGTPKGTGLGVFVGKLVEDYGSVTVNGLETLFGYELDNYELADYIEEVIMDAIINSKACSYGFIVLGDREQTRYVGLLQDDMQPRKNSFDLREYTYLKEY